MKRIAIALILFQLIGCTKQPTIVNIPKDKKEQTHYSLWDYKTWNYTHILLTFLIATTVILAITNIRKYYTIKDLAKERDENNQTIREQKEQIKIYKNVVEIMNAIEKEELGQEVERLTNVIAPQIEEKIQNGEITKETINEAREVQLNKKPTQQQGITFIEDPQKRSNIYYQIRERYIDRQLVKEMIEKFVVMKEETPIKALVVATKSEIKLDKYKEVIEKVLKSSILELNKRDHNEKKLIGTRAGGYTHEQEDLESIIGCLMIIEYCKEINDFNIFQATLPEAR
jgi:hypothetical protein